MKKSGQLSLGLFLGAILGGTVQANAIDADAARLLQDGTEEIVQGDLVHAAADLEAAVLLAPRNAEAWFQLGLLYSKTADFREAEAAFRKAVEMNPHYAEAHFWLGSILIIDPQNKLDWAGAVAESRAALLEKPDYTDALNLLGTGLTNLGQLDEAVEVLKRAIAIEPSSAAGHFNLAVALEKSDHPQEAKGEYEAAIAARSDYPEASSALGKLLLRLGKPAQAEQLLLRSLCLNPDLADVHYALARALRALKRTSAAKIEFEEAADLARLQPEGIESMHLSNEGLALGSRGDFTGAIASFRRAIALNPTDGVPHYNLGLMQADAGDVKGAIRELTVAISLLPGQAKPWFDLGRAYERQGDGERALEAFAWAARLAPSDDAMQAKLRSFETAGIPLGELPQHSLYIPNDTAEDHLASGQKLRQEGRPMDAVSELLRALSLEPANADARGSLASAYVSMGNLDKAMLEYHKLLLVSPQDASAHFALGKILLKQGHAAQAASQFRAVLAYQPESAEARASLAQAVRASAAH